MLSELAPLVHQIQATSNKVFLPTGITASVSAPKNEIMVLMREVSTINEQNGPYLVNTKDSGAKVSNTKITQICQRFSLRTINFLANGADLEQIKGQLINEIKLIMMQGLKLVGGY